MRRQWLLCFCILFISATAFSQKARYQGTCTLCQLDRTLVVKLKYGVLSLKVGRWHFKTVLGANVSEKQAVSVCMKALSGKLGKLCRKTNYSPVEFVNFVSLFSSKAIRSVYHPSDVPPELVGSTPVTESSYFGLIRASDGHIIISLLGRSKTDSLFYWNSDSGKYIYNYATINNDALVHSNSETLTHLGDSLKSRNDPVLPALPVVPAIQPDTVKDTTAKKDTATDPPNLNVTLLNAANFDFTGKLSTSYLGLLNIFAPNVIPHTKLGFNFGIEKVNYGTTNINGNDSNQVQYFHQNFLLNPLQVNTDGNTINAGAKYLQQYNQYSFTSSNVVWSFYLDPLWQICQWSNKYPQQGLYAHVHGELLLNQWTRTATMKNLYQNPDTLVTSGTTTTKGFYWVAKNPIVANYNFISAYFGAGLTLLTRLFNEKSFFYCQGTIGKANNTPDFTKLNDPTSLLNANGTYSSDSIVNNRSRAFYLLRTSYIQALSVNSQIVIGFHVRGNFGDLNCQYAAYVGLNLDLTAVSKLITGN